MIWLLRILLDFIWGRPQTRYFGTLSNEEIDQYRRNPTWPDHDTG